MRNIMENLSGWGERRGRDSPSDTVMPLLASSVTTARLLGNSGASVTMETLSRLP